uniref:1-acyl-sn-glycerol-3-phosphate acyltransferase n=1 Tax=Aromatoleum toluolicum TaxID=90060 RepID=A0ABX1NEK6_9RHOO|nr:1-acyl-sn-glycerol-3-phosphate acyltransferase [Aromatoleum toluolicum]
MLTVLTIYPLSRDATRLSLRRRWSQRLLAILGIELRVAGQAIQPGCMLVANHISWLDIFVINALAPSAFVSKAEVRGWPLIGWLATRNETVFLRRGSRGHAKIINAEIATLLDGGRNVAVFPEGTTTDGSHVLHFHAALLQPAIECGHPIQPLALTYAGAGGQPNRAAAYDGDITLGQCLRNIVAEPHLIARIDAAAPIATQGVHRRHVAAMSHAAIVARLPSVGDVTAHSPGDEDARKKVA